VTLDVGERQILKDGKPVPLTPKAFDLLAVLASNPGRLMTKDDLLQAVWGEVVVEESNLAYNISAIRKALGEGGEGQRYVETVPKRGYRFAAQVTRTDRNDSGHSTVAAMVAPTPTKGDDDDGAADSPGFGNRVEGPQDLSSGVSSERGRWWRRVLAACGVLVIAMIAAMTAVAVAVWRRPVAPPDATRFQIPLHGRLAESGVFEVSPDGRHLAFAAEGTDGIMRLWVRSMNALPPFPLPGTDGFTIFPPPIWSPDSRQIVFTSGGALKKADLMGGAPQRLCDLPDVAVGGSWIGEGSLLLGNPVGGLVRCDVSTGATSVVTVAEPMEVHLFPVILSDGHHSSPPSSSGRSGPPTIGSSSARAGGARCLRAHGRRRAAVGVQDKRRQRNADEYHAGFTGASVYDNRRLQDAERRVGANERLAERSADQRQLKLPADDN
jgi:DNA-binding winged helix-turn-helix (wHTH) protein